MAHIAWGCSVSSLDNIQTHRDWIQPNFCQLLLTFSELSGSLLQWLGEVCKPKGLLGLPTDWPSVQAVKLNQNPTTKKPNNPSLQKKKPDQNNNKEENLLETSFFSGCQPCEFSVRAALLQPRHPLTAAAELRGTALLFSQLLWLSKIKRMDR